MPLPNFERDFDIQLIQNHKKIPLRSTQVYLLYSDAVANIYQISGAIIELRYDTESIDRYDEATLQFAPQMISMLKRVLAWATSVVSDFFEVLRSPA